MTDSTEQTTAGGADDDKVIKEIPIHRIETEGLQTRAGLNPETVSEYADAMEAGACFPQPIVFFDGTTDAEGNVIYWLADGFHRLAGAKQIGCNFIKCELRAGTKRDALMHSFKANATHGLRRTNADKDHAARICLLDEEWVKRTNGVISDICAVDAKTVGRVRGELEEAGDIPRLDHHIGADGKLYPATKTQKPAPASVREIPKLENAAAADESQSANADELANVPPTERENQESDESDIDVKKRASKNGKPIVDGKARQQALADASAFSRSLRSFSVPLYNDYSDLFSKVMRDIKAYRNPAPVHKTVSEPAPVEEKAPW